MFCSMLFLTRHVWKPLTQRQLAYKNALSPPSRKPILFQKVLKKPRKRWGKFVFLPPRENSFLFFWPCSFLLSISCTNEGRLHILLFLFILQGLCKVHHPSLLSVLQSLHTEHWNSERHQKYWKCGAGSPQWFEHSVWRLEQNEPISGDLMPGTSVVARIIFWGFSSQCHHITLMTICFMAWLVSMRFCISLSACNLLC